MYAYKVRDSLGRIVEGTLAALSQDEATAQLRRDGFSVLSISETDDDDDASLMGGRITRKSIVYITTQLAVMVDTGITLSTALSGIAAQEQNPRLKKLLIDLHGAVESGQDFSSVLEQHPRYFDRTYVALIRASEATGKLAEMLDRIASYLRRELENRQKVRAALTYPAVMLALAAAVTIFLLTYVLPKFQPLFTRKGVQLPKPTVVMMAVSNSLIEHWPWWIAGTIAAVIGLFIYKGTDSGRRHFDYLKLHVPLLGSLYRRVILSRSVSTLGTMVASGVSMLEALRLTGDVAANYYYQKLWEAVRDQVTAGRQINEALAGHPLVPPTLVQMISAGEASGKLDVVLEKVASFYDREVDAALKSTTAIIEPILICCMGAVVGGIAMSLLLPIFTLSRTPG
jgi:type IV pilus assembly protein PilC